jgi:hypothetical protein
MPYEMRDNSGTLFKNEDKQEDTHADYQGEALVDGTLYWFNAWIKTGKSGKKFMSCSFKPKRKDAPAKESPNKGAADLEDDIPF